MEMDSEDGYLVSQMDRIQWKARNRANEEEASLFGEGKDIPKGSWDEFTTSEMGLIQGVMFESVLLLILYHLICLHD